MVCTRPLKQDESLKQPILRLMHNSDHPYARSGNVSFRQNDRNLVSSEINLKTRSHLFNIDEVVVSGRGRSSQSSPPHPPKVHDLRCACVSTLENSIADRQIELTISDQYSWLEARMAEDEEQNWSSFLAGQNLRMTRLKLDWFLELGVIHKPRGQNFGYFLPPSWSLLLNKAYVIKWSFG